MNVWYYIEFIEIFCDYYDYMTVVSSLVLGFDSHVFYVQVLARPEWTNHELRASWERRCTYLVRFWRGATCTHHVFR